MAAPVQWVATIQGPLHVSLAIVLVLVIGGVEGCSLVGGVPKELEEGYDE
jgi:hypothetical protein